MRRRAAFYYTLSGTFVLLCSCGGDIGGSILGGDHPASSGTNGDGGSMMDPGDGDGGMYLGQGGEGGDLPNSGNGFCGNELTGTIRDFSASHPDFEYNIAVDQGFVSPALGPDKKPVYIGGSGTETTNGAETFDQWYRNVSGVNENIPLTIALTPSGDGIYTYDNSSFFPIDDLGFGNEGNSHNYHFTFELHTRFIYQGGEVFSFTGDDDLFTFINGALAIDLGGVHGAMSQTIELDERAAELGLVVGEIYDLDFFFAERHTVESNFRIDTTISFVDCGDPEIN